MDKSWRFWYEWPYVPKTGAWHVYLGPQITRTRYAGGYLRLSVGLLFVNIHLSFYGKGE